MGDPVTMGAAALSLGSMGLSAASKGVAAVGTATADNFKAEQLEEAATYGDLKAVQVGGQLTRNLNITLTNMDAVRAAGKVDPTSPSAVAVRDFTEGTGIDQRDITVNNITQQAKMDEANAQYERQASQTALLGGDLGIAGDLLKGASGLFKSSGGPSSG